MLWAAALLAATTLFQSLLEIHHVRPMGEDQTDGKGRRRRRVRRGKGCRRFDGQADGPSVGGRRLGVDSTNEATSAAAASAAKLTDSAAKSASEAANKTADVASDAVAATKTAATQTVDAAKKGLA